MPRKPWWIENWLSVWAQSMVTSGTESSWRPVNSSATLRSSPIQDILLVMGVMEHRVLLVSLLMAHNWWSWSEHEPAKCFCLSHHIPCYHQQALGSGWHDSAYRCQAGEHGEGFGRTSLLTLHHKKYVGVKSTLCRSRCLSTAGKGWYALCICWCMAQWRPLSTEGVICSRMKTPTPIPHHPDIY